MDDALRAGAALYNEGRYHAAHDAWEARWLDAETGTPDERFLLCLIQFTAVVYHAAVRNWAGAASLADSASEYLADLPATYRGVPRAPILDCLDRASADPEHIERGGAPELVVEGVAVGYEDLQFEASATVAPILASEDGFDQAPIQSAIEYARAEVSDAGGGTFTGLVFSFVRDPAKRGFIYQRLADHVEREAAKASDVEGLFE
jgi:hypothetical protein